MTANKASIHVTANQATGKASRNETLSNMLRAPSGGSQWRGSAQSITIGPVLGPVQRSSCFCSSHVSSVALSIHLTVSTRGPGGKETPPRLFEEVHFSANKRRLHTRGRARPDERRERRADGGERWHSLKYLLWQSVNSASVRPMDLLTITWEEPNERIDAIA